MSASRAFGLASSADVLIAAPGEAALGVVAEDDAVHLGSDGEGTRVGGLGERGVRVDVVRAGVEVGHLEEVRGAETGAVANLPDADDVVRAGGEDALAVGVDGERAHAPHGRT